MDRLIINILRIKQFRNLQNIELNFQDGYNEIAGDNGLGKTAVLDAIRYLLFNSNDHFKKADNIKTIYATSDSKNENSNLPCLEAQFTFRNKIIKLKIMNEQYYVNDIQLKNIGAYLDMIARELGLSSIDVLTGYIDYLELESTLGSNKDAKIQITNSILSITNSTLPPDKRIDPDSLDKTFFEIEELGDRIKSSAKDYKVVNNTIENYKINNPEVKDWDNMVPADEQQYILLHNKISKYDNVATQIKTVTDEINRIEPQLQKLQELSKQDSSNTSTDIPKKEGFWKKLLTFLLGIITLGIYFIIKAHKSKNQSQTGTTTSQYRSNENELRRLMEAKLQLQAQRDRLLQSPDYVNIDIATLRAQELEIKQSDSNSQDLNLKKHRYQELRNELNKIKDDITKLIDNQNMLKEKRMSIIRSINSQLQESFKGFDISLMDEKENATVIIKYNNVDFKNMNHAAKIKIVHALSEYLARNINIQVFSLIDQIESVNNFDANGNQVIACRVTHDKELKLNGKNLY